MNLSSRQLVVGGGLLACTWLIACGGPEQFRSGGDSGLTGVGGSIGTGSGGAGPASGSGGAGTGGASETGGRGTGGAATSSGGRGASSGGATETGGRGSGGAGTGGAGGRGTGGAATGSGGRNGGGSGGTAGRGSGGAAAGGRAAGGSGNGGRAAGGAAGGATGTGPCAGLCSNPVTIPKGMNSGGLGTGVTCHQVTSMVQGIVCGNFTAPRTFSVNGTAVNCTGNITPPALHNGGYCMQATAGQTPSAYFTTY